MTYNKILAGDIGGSHISIALFENSNDKISLINMGREGVDSQGSKGEILDAWASLMLKFVEPKSKVMLGLAMPAPFDYDKGIFWIKDQGKFLALYGVDLKKEISERLEISTDCIYFVNDAEAFLKGESNYGEGIGFENILGMTLGSGLGSSFKFGNSFADAALWTEPFRDGIAEDYLGTVWFVDWAEKNLKKKYKGLKEILLDVKDKEMIKSAFQEYASNLAEFIFEYDQKYNFDHVVIGGNVTKAKTLFEENLNLNLKKLGFEKSVGFSKMGEKSALYGVLASLEDENNQLIKSVF
ncbi:ROK family protein [Mongoliibacter ruber]|uniref:Glucokinase n=1 Tax=Mongoliibacter ruber TaxID=1750599 RepID=A0A2T0WP94_9BACT|nr:ROK family protein [Mongoliibacter ruber]PRY88519.1 glucokinase [Mongoliibacter ruber]